MTTPPRVLVIGAGIGGLTAAIVLADHGLEVDLVERGPAPGGHAARLACKATDRCVRCGACLVTAAIEVATDHPRIRLHLSSRAEAVRATDAGFTYRLVSETAAAEAAADAVLIAAGFDLFDPRDKPYGFGLYPDVVTNLQVETLLRSPDGVVKPSDGTPPARVAFLQCVGSRDRKLDHLWCSDILLRRFGEGRRAHQGGPSGDRNHRLLHRHPVVRPGFRGGPERIPPQPALRARGAGRGIPGRHRGDPADLAGAGIAPGAARKRSTWWSWPAAWCRRPGWPRRRPGSACARRRPASSPRPVPRVSLPPVRCAGR